jgi:hypothetical protein
VHELDVEWDGERTVSAYYRTSLRPLDDTLAPVLPALALAFGR